MIIIRNIILESDNPDKLKQKISKLINKKDFSYEIYRKSIDSRANNLRVNVDINNYKKRRDEKIVELAADTARKVQRSKKSWNLKYMNSYERRLAHEEISKYPNVASHSEGQEPKRYVVVDYVGDDEE